MNQEEIMWHYRRFLVNELKWEVRNRREVWFTNLIGMEEAVPYRVEGPQWERAMLPFVVKRGRKR